MARAAGDFSLSVKYISLFRHELLRCAALTIQRRNPPPWRTSRAGQRHQRETMSPDGNSKPNSELTPEERQAKARIKKLSKLQSKIRKLEKRIAHAGRFNKVDVVEASKIELINLANDSEYRQEALSFVAGEYQYMFDQGRSAAEGHATVEVGHGRPSSDSKTPTEPELVEIEARAIIAKISNELFQHMYTDQLSDDDAPDVDPAIQKRKEAEAKQKRLKALRAAKSDHQTKAKQMCQAMTKGEQEEFMFDDASALWGYTRQKYVERARLIRQSFLKLHPRAGGPTGIALSIEEIDVKDRIWAALMSVDRVCSIGCGPASDVAGVLALKKNVCLENNREYDAPSILLLDYAIEPWKATILDISVPIMSNHGLVDTAMLLCERTDVTDVVCGEELCARNQSSGGKTLYITSYLLSEQRDKWHDFYRLLIREAKSGDIFYFCEPKPWQLHLLIRLTSEWLEFLWADSSMYFGEMQATEQRAGPAVLLAIRK